MDTFKTVNKTYINSKKICFEPILSGKCQTTFFLPFSEESRITDTLNKIFSSNFDRPSRSIESTKKKTWDLEIRGSFDDSKFNKTMLQKKGCKILPIKLAGSISSFSIQTKKRETKVTVNFSMNYKLDNCLKIIKGEDESTEKSPKLRDNFPQTVNIQKENLSQQIREIKRVHIYLKPKNEKIEAPILKIAEENQTEKKRIESNGIFLDSIFHNFMTFGPLKIELKRFLNNIDLNVHLETHSKQNLSELDHAHFDLLRKYLNPFPKKIHIEKIENSVAKISEFLFKLQDYQKTVESFGIPLISDLMKNDMGLNLKEKIRSNKSECELLFATNPMGFLFYYVIKFEDFFIDSKTATKFTDKFIEIYRFPRFLVFQSIYPLTEIFSRLLEFFVSQYKQAKLNKFVELVNHGRTSISDYELIDADSLKLDQLPAIKTVLQELSKQYIRSNFGGIFTIPLNDKIVKFTLPEKVNSMYAESGMDHSKVFQHFSFEEILLLASSIVSERTLVFISRKQKKISRSISTILGLLRPFHWVFPLIYSLPRDCLEMLASPVPLIAGVQNDAKSFMIDFESRLECGNSKSMLNKTTVFVFLDEGIIKCDQSVLAGNYLPSNFGFLKRAEKIYRENFGNKSSKFVKIESSKSKNAAKFVGRSALSKTLPSLLEKNFKEAEKKVKVDGNAKSYELFMIFGILWLEMIEMSKKNESTKDNFLKTLLGSQAFAFYQQEQNEDFEKANN